MAEFTDEVFIRMHAFSIADPSVLLSFVDQNLGITAGRHGKRLRIFRQTFRQPLKAAHLISYYHFVIPVAFHLCSDRDNVSAFDVLDDNAGE
ncbi:hypothetical protein D3C81_1839030 [compost metagenome]